MDSSEYVIILADDDEDDLLLLSLVFKNMRSGYPVQTVKNGRELLDYLNDLNSLEGKSIPKKPGLVFLDINMPVMNGIEALRVIRKHAHYSRLPVVMLSTTKDQTTIDTCYDIGAVGYITKDFDLSRLEEQLDIAIKYWFYAVHHPIH
ncbi:MAG: response regulator [Chloroflexi bacterium]|nr:MAG: response regulator [Chloroflexota bacterium]